MMTGEEVRALKRGDKIIYAGSYPSATGIEGKQGTPAFFYDWSGDHYAKVRWIDRNGTVRRMVRISVLSIIDRCV